MRDGNGAIHRSLESAAVDCNLAPSYGSGDSIGRGFALPLHLIFIDPIRTADRKEATLASMHIYTPHMRETGSEFFALFIAAVGSKRMIVIRASELGRLCGL